MCFVNSFRETVGLFKIPSDNLLWWHINYCRLFNSESIFIHINSSISNSSIYPNFSSI